MGLRQYINDAEFSKKINHSEIGRRFENSDFARSIEFTVQGINEDIRSNNYLQKATGILIASFFPVASMAQYQLAKTIKKYSPSTYKTFSSNPDLVLNHPQQ